MTKLYAEVYKLQAGARHAANVASNAGQMEAVRTWSIREEAYHDVIKLLGDPEITPSRWKRLVCKIFHQRYSLKCPNCGGHF
jgi:hypothetical protein